MRHEIKTFSDMDYAIDEMRYWIEHGDYDRIYSNRGYVLERARDLMSPAYVHLWMIMYPLEGMEYTRTNNMQDLANWLYQIVTRIKGKLSVHSVYVELDGNYLRYVRSDLHKNHGYPDLTGQLGNDISESMSDIMTEIDHDIIINSRKDKHYQITKQRIQEIIKEVLEL